MIFVDNILIISKTLEEHIMNLHTIFEKFQQACISSNLDKCECMRLSIKVLGDIVYEKGKQPDPSKKKKYHEVPDTEKCERVESIPKFNGIL